MSNGKSLIVLAQEYRQFAEQIDSVIETEGDSALQELMNVSSLAVEQKASATALYIKRVGMLADQISAQVRDMNERKRELEKRQERVKQYLLTCMQAAGITKIENADLTIRIQKGRDSCEIFDERMVPLEYMKQPQPVPNKAAILADMKAGVIIDGCRIKNQESVVIK